MKRRWRSIATAGGYLDADTSDALDDGHRTPGGLWWAIVTLSLTLIAPNAFATTLEPGDIVLDRSSLVIDGRNVMLRVDPAVGTQSPFPSAEESLRAGYAIDSDSRGNLFLFSLNPSHGQPDMYFYRTADGTQELLAERVSTPVPVAVDSQDRVLTVSTSLDLLRVDPNSGATETLASLPTLGLSGVSDLAVGSDELVYLFGHSASTGSDSVVMSLDASTGLTRMITTLSAGTFNEVITEVASDGTLLVSGWSGFGGIRRIDPITGSELPAVAPGWHTTGIDLDSDGNLVVLGFQPGSAPELFQIASDSGAASTISSGGFLGGGHIHGD